MDLEIAGEPIVIIDTPGRRVDVIFEARVSPNSVPQEPVAQYPEIIEVRWFDPARLPRLQEEAAGALSESGERKATGRRTTSRAGT